MIVRTLSLSICLLVSIVVLPILTGCSGGEFGSELREKPKHASALSPAGGTTLHLPQDQPFYITLAESHKTPGLGGKADADAQADKKGTAEATARVDNGGSATASFQIGHSMKNDSDRMMNLHVRVVCDYESAAGAAPPGPLPDAQVGLNLYARDGRNRLLTSMNLVKQASDAGAASSKNRKEIEFSIPLGAHEWIHIYLAGGVQIETPEGRSADGVVKLTDLEMEIQQEVAPPLEPVGTNTNP